MFQGRREESIARNRNLPFDAKTIDRMILSHAHIDHSGNIPTLCKSGYKGDILCTSATRDLANVMLRDSAHIQMSDSEHVTERNQRRGLPPVEPLYTIDDAEASIKQFVGFAYGRPVPVTPGITATFFDAGHILGAAITLLEIVEDGRHMRLAFTGDLGRRGLPILRDPQLVPDIDCLITESTYGNRIHGDITQMEEELRQVILGAIERGGKLLIPAFAVERRRKSCIRSTGSLTRADCLQFRSMWTAHWRWTPLRSSGCIRRSLTARPASSSSSGGTPSASIGSRIFGRWKNPRG